MILVEQFILRSPKPQIVRLEYNYETREVGFIIASSHGMDCYTRGFILEPDDLPRLIGALTKIHEEIVNIQG